MIPTCRRRFLGLALLLAACSEDHHVPMGETSAGTDAAKVDEVDAAAEFIDCDDDTSVVPDSLVCTGLYASLLDQRIAPSVREFVPAYPLWSDGAEKRRWIQLPEGEKIDNTRPNEWVFPVGTKLWKEFQIDHKRIETRLFWKVRSDRWLYGTYAWNDDDSAATFSLGGDIQTKSGAYHLPTREECTDCHDGQPDSVLGFSAVNLGLEGASGITLAQLVKEGLLTKKPPITELSIGADELGLDDDGVPLTAKVLGVLHTNCGQPCHNNTAGAKAKLSSQNLRLDSTLLDGRPPDQTFNVIATAIGKRAEGVQWDSHPFRILPGDPANSLIYQLMSYRDPSGMGRGQMPPIASRKVDPAAVALVEKWIRALDAGTQASELTATMDGGTAVMVDPGMDAASALDAAAPAMDSGAGTELDAGSDAGVDAEVDASVDAGPDATIANDAEIDATDSALATGDAETDAVADETDDPETGI